MVLQMLREVIANHTGVAPPPLPAQQPAKAYGAARMADAAPLLRALPALCPGDGIPTLKPAPMEAYGQPCAPRSCFSNPPENPNALTLKGSAFTLDPCAPGLHSTGVPVHVPTEQSPVTSLVSYPRWPLERAYSVWLSCGIYLLSSLSAPASP